VIPLGLAQVWVEHDLQPKVRVDDLGGLASAAQGATVERGKIVLLFNQPLAQPRGLLAAQIGQVSVRPKRVVKVSIRLPVAGKNEFGHLAFGVSQLLYPLEFLGSGEVDGSSVSWCSCCRSPALGDVEA
jgi:hypothetical protein